MACPMEKSSYNRCFNELPPTLFYSPNGVKEYMKKIKTIFERNWEGDRTVVDKYVDGAYLAITNNCVATEKMDGMNVRLTVRNHICVRLEKRRNPDKIQKHKGIEEPWYTEAFESEPSDKYLFEALKNTDLSEVEDGEWSGEALGRTFRATR